MGLFDNLFLDKNTPMKINNGEEHPGDPSQAGGTVQPIGGSPGTGDGANAGQSGANPPTDDTTAAATVNIEGMPAVIDTTIAPVTTENATSPVSFDIGGDIGFDIGGLPDTTTSDVSPLAPSSTVVENASDVVSFIGVTTPMNTTPDAGLTPEVSLIPDVTLDTPSQDASSAPFVVDISPVTIIENTPSTSDEKSAESLIIPTESSPIIDITSDGIISDPPSENITRSTSSTESPLTSLIGGFSRESTPSSTPITPETMSTPVTDTSTPITTDTAANTDALFGLFTTSEEGKKEETVIVAPEVAPVASSDVLESIMTPPITPEVSVEKEIIKTESTAEILGGNTPEGESTTDEDHSMSSVGKELARMTRSPRLQGKLLGFISGLEELSKEEEVVKAEKRKQIESYQLRITELKAEYETRIHALELEEADLKKQISQMDQEREHLTQVIDGFKKELEVV